MRVSIAQKLVSTTTSQTCNIRACTTSNETLCTNPQTQTRPDPPDHLNRDTVEVQSQSTITSLQGKEGKVYRQEKREREGLPVKSAPRGSSVDTPPPALAPCSSCRSDDSWSILQDKHVSPDIHASTKMYQTICKKSKNRGTRLFGPELGTSQKLQPLLVPLYLRGICK